MYITNVTKIATQSRFLMNVTISVARFGDPHRLLWQMRANYFCVFSCLALFNLRNFLCYFWCALELFLCLIFLPKIIYRDIMSIYVRKRRQFRKINSREYCHLKIIKSSARFFLVAPRGLICGQRIATAFPAEILTKHFQFFQFFKKCISESFYRVGSMHLLRLLERRHTQCVKLTSTTCANFRLKYESYYYNYAKQRYRPTYSIFRNIYNVGI